jgi:spore germination protein YaaH
MIAISYNVAKWSLDYIITITVEITSKKWCQMIAISYNVAKWSLDYIITITVEITSKIGVR